MTSLRQSRTFLLLRALAAGAVLALALPPIGLWPVIFVSLPLAVTAMRRLPGTLGNAVLTGFSFGFGYFIVAFHWIGFAFLVDAATYLWMMPIAVGGLAAFMAFYWALAFATAHLLKRRGVPLIASLPLALAIAEVARGHFFTGFPWAAPGLIADSMGGVLQAASLIGMPGLTYWVLLWGMLPLFIWRRRPLASARSIVPVVLLALLPAGWLWGDWRLSSLHYDDVPGVRLLLVQPNISQDDKWRSENAGAIFDKLLVLSTRGEAAQGATHIIWPESSVPFLLDESSVGLARLADRLQSGQTLIAGAIRRERDSKDGERFFTSILEIDEEGVVEERYDKWRLVPGGEFLPLAWLLEPLGFRKVVNVPESFSAGPGPRSFALGAAGRAGLLICYEAIFPVPLVEAQIRPDWLINVTNDGWFGRSVGPYQHLAQVRMRAVEQNMAVARAANTGVSAVIDGAGRFVRRTALGEEGAVSSPLPARGEETVFAKWGHLLPFAVALFVSVVLAAWSGRVREVS